MTPQQKALRDAYLSEMWPTCRELPRHVRAEKRRADRLQQRKMEERAIEAASTGSTSVEAEVSTGCAETAAREAS